MNCSYKLSKSEVVKAMQLHGRGSKFILVTLSFICVVLAVIGLMTEHKAISFGAVIGGVVGYFGVFLLLIPLNAKKQFKQHRALRVEISMEVSEQGVNFKSESGESKLQWSDIHKWKFGRGIYLLYITSNMFHMVPLNLIHK